MESEQQKLEREEKELAELKAAKEEAEKLHKKKTLTLDEELKIMQEDQKKNLKHHAELAKAKDLPKHPHKHIELESEKLKK